MTSHDVLGQCLDQIERGIEFRSALMGEKNRFSVPYAQALLDAVDLFERLRIGYALVGGIAAMCYGRARFTEDVDFVAASGHADLLKANAEVMRSCHFDPSCTWKLYHESGAQVDLWKDEYSDQIAARATEVALAGRKVKIAEVHDLVAMKLRADRPQDDFDISEIIRAGRVNEATLKARVTAEQFERFLQIKHRTP